MTRLRLFVYNKMSATAAVYKFNVEMTCEGCSGAVQRVLSKQQGQGIDSFDIDLANKTVSVSSSLTADQVLEIIKKTGKTTTLIN